MATVEYVAEEAVFEDVIHCIEWCKAEFNLNDWKIYLNTSDICPKFFEETDKDLADAFAMTIYQKRRLRAYVWIPINRIYKRGHNVFQTTIHEMLHVMLCDVGHNIDDDDSDNVEDCAIHRLESTLFKLYCIENKRKIPMIIQKYWRD